MRTLLPNCVAQAFRTSRCSSSTAIGSTPLNGSSRRINFGIGDERAGDLELATLAAREAFGSLIAILRRGRIVRSRCSARPLRSARLIEQRLQNRHQILPYRKPAKIGALLRQVAQLQAWPAGTSASRSDVLAVKRDRAAESGVTMPRIMRKVVVLPAPLRPSRPTISCCWSEKLTSSTTRRPV